MTDEPITTFIIATIGRPTLERAFRSAQMPGSHCRYLLDSERIGEGEIRNKLIETVTTPWVSILDDDDTVMADYVERLREEIINHPDAAIINFKRYFLQGMIEPAWPSVEFKNAGQSFSVRTDIARKHPFFSEIHEDWHFQRRIHEAGHKVHFSRYLTYRVRH